MLRFVIESNFVVTVQTEHLNIFIGFSAGLVHTVSLISADVLLRALKKDLMLWLVSQWTTAL